MKDKRLEHIKNVIQPWDENQFIRICYLNLNGDEGLVTNAQYNEYINKIRAKVFENGYTEEDLEKIISYGKAIAMTMDGLTMDFS